MNTFFRKFFGLSLIFFAVLGIIFSLFGVINIWRVRAAALPAVEETITLFDAALDTTTEGLSIMDQSLQAASGTIIATEEATLAIAQTMNDIDSIVSGFLDIVNLIPLVDFGGQDVDLATSSGNLGTAEQELLGVATNLSLIGVNLSNAQQVVTDYQTAVTTSKEQLENLRENGPKWITTSAVVLTIMLIWLAIAQIGLLIQGWEMLRTKIER